jgi:hypothetical protein
VPLKSIIQIIDTGIPGDPVQDPKIVQIISDAGLTSGSTIGDFLDNPDLYIDLTSTGGSVKSVNGEIGHVILDMEDINDVEISRLTTGDLLRFNGTNWSNVDTIDGGQYSGTRINQEPSPEISRPSRSSRSNKKNSNNSTIKL